MLKTQQFIHAQRQFAVITGVQSARKNRPDALSLRSFGYLPNHRCDAAVGRASAKLFEAEGVAVAPKMFLQLGAVGRSVYQRPRNLVHLLMTVWARYGSHSPKFDVEPHGGFGL